MADLEAAITDQTAVMSLMWAKNETGVLFPVEKIAEICRSRGVLYHCDAVQAAGKVEIDVQKVPADYLSLTGHKFHAPKGIGALYVRRKAPFAPLIYGGHQERNRRGGTESVPLIVGMGKAAELARIRNVVQCSLSSVAAFPVAFWKLIGKYFRTFEVKFCTFLAEYFGYCCFALYLRGFGGISKCLQLFLFGSGYAG